MVKGQINVVLLEWIIFLVSSYVLKSYYNMFLVGPERYPSTLRCPYQRGAWQTRLMTTTPTFPQSLRWEILSTS